MVNTIEARLSLNVFDSIALVAIGAYLTSFTLAALPWSAAALLFAVLV